MGSYRQIGLVVRDLEKTMEQWWTVLGVGPWNVKHQTADSISEFQVDGQPVSEDFDLYVASAWVGEIQFELIQPIKGPNIFWRHLESKGEGLHHVKQVVSDDELPGTLAKFAERGYNVIESGRVVENLHYFLDTEDDLGFILEVGNAGKGSPPDRIYPPAD
jgi:hypothetical protein